MFFLFSGLVVVCYNLELLLVCFLTVYFLQRRKGVSCSVRNRLEMKKALNKIGAFLYKLMKFWAYETSLATVFLYWFGAVKVKWQVPKNWQSLTAKVFCNFGRTGFVQTQRQQEQTEEHYGNFSCIWKLAEELVISVSAGERVLTSFKDQVT